MAEPIHLFVSSSPELQAERAIVGQVAAKLPVALGWQIDHTPLPGQVAATDLARVARCDLYVVILGQDFAAPMGAELRQALNVGTKPLAYRKRCSRSPSSQDAVRRLDVEWRTFSQPDALRAWCARDMLEALIQQTASLGLDLGELEALLKLAQEEVEQMVTRPGQGRQRGEAGRSGVILGREVWEDET
jgi:hypothetical protein